MVCYNFSIQKKCVECGIDILCKNNNQRRCKECGIKRKKEYNLKFQKTKKTRKRIRIWEKENRKRQEIKEKKRLRDYAYHNLREKLLEKHSSCINCGSKEKLELHHKTYDNSGNIIVLCRKCHKEEHRRVFKCRK